MAEIGCFAAWGVIMRILLTAATGVVGNQLLPQLVGEGHTVIACTRDNTKAESLRASGAQPSVFDVLHRQATIEAVLRAQPDVVVHQMTALAGVQSYRNLDRALAQTNLLRTTGLDHLLEGAQLARASRFIAHSYGGWSMERVGGPIKTEFDPLDTHVPSSMAKSLAAIRHLESSVPAARGLTGIVLRCGSFYGPGTGFARDGSMINLIMKRALPLIGSGAGVWSFVHVADAALATRNAMTHGAAGIYNIADDEPSAVADWLPALATAFGARPPLHIPTWLGRLVAGESTVLQMTTTRGLANAKAKENLGWFPTRSTWRKGFVEDVKAVAQAPV